MLRMTSGTPPRQLYGLARSDGMFATPVMSVARSGIVGGSGIS